MSTTEATTAAAAADLRDELKRRIDALPESRLPMAVTFIRYLDDYLDELAREDAFENMDDPPYGPKFIAAMAKGEADIEAGRMTPWRKVRNDV